MSVTRTGPVAAPVGLAEAKSFLRIEHDDDDALIAGLLNSATELCELFTGQVLLVAAFSEVIPASAEWRRLARTPVPEIAKVEGLPAEGSAFALPVDSYAIDIDAARSAWLKASTGMAWSSAAR